jgi:hypothetical protein
LLACLHCSQINAKSFVGRWAFNYFSIDITLCLCLKICYSICFITIWITLGLYHKILINSLTVVFLFINRQAKFKNSFRSNWIEGKNSFKSPLTIKAQLKREKKIEKMKKWNQCFHFFMHQVRQCDGSFYRITFYR